METRQKVLGEYSRFKFPYIYGIRYSRISLLRLEKTLTKTAEIAIQATFIHSFNPVLKLKDPHRLSSLCIHLATQMLVVYIDYFVSNIIANAETSEQNVPWRVFLLSVEV